MITGLFPFLSKEPVVFDIGSNKGHFTDLFLEEYKEEGKLYLFEPSEKLISFTEIKYEYKTNITFERLAAYRTTGKVEFFYFENFNNELSSVYPDKEGWKDLPMKNKVVSTVSLDDYCKDKKIERIDYLKIDTEGSEVDVLLGCSSLIKGSQIGIIQVEYGGHYTRAAKSFQDIIDLFNGTGYKIYSYKEDGNYWEVKDFVEDFHAENYIITKEEIHNYCSAGWNNEFIINTSELPKFEMCLEIGAFEGMTTKYMCENLLNHGGRVIVVDPLEDYYIEGDTEHPFFKGQYPRFSRNTRGLPVELKRGKSQDELPKLNALRFDFIYLDGDHREEAVYHDAVWAFAICKNGGFILFDDYTWREETTSGIDRFLNEFGASLSILIKGYQVLIRKVHNQYNDITFKFYQ